MFGVEDRNESGYVTQQTQASLAQTIAAAARAELGAEAPETAASAEPSDQQFESHALACATLRDLGRRYAAAGYQDAVVAFAALSKQAAGSPLSTLLASAELPAYRSCFADGYQEASAPLWEDPRGKAGLAIGSLFGLVTGGVVGFWLARR